jgi:WD repeat-containing protein 48
MAVSQLAQHSNETPTANAKHRPEDLYDILCNDVLLPLNMTLAAVRQHVWKQSTELILCYRRVIPPSYPGKDRGGNAKASRR